MENNSGELSPPLKKFLITHFENKQKTRKQEKINSTSINFKIKSNFFFTNNFVYLPNTIIFTQNVHQRTTVVGGDVLIEHNLNCVL